MDVGCATSLGFKIRVKTDSRRLFAFLRDVNERSIPDYSFEPLENDGSEKGTGFDRELVVLEDSSSQSITLSDDRKVLTVRFSAESLITKDSEFLLIFMFTELYSRRSIFCAHGVGLQAPEGRGILIIGNSTDGKSVASFPLLQAGYRYIGNDRVLLQHRNGCVVMIGGSTPIRLRVGALRTYLPDALIHSGANSNEWGTFQSLKLAELHFHRSSQADLSLIFRVKIVPVSEEYCTCIPLAELDGPFAPGKIYQSLSYYATNHTLVHVGTQKPFPALDSFEAAQKRLDFAGQMAKQAKSYEIFGNLDWAIEKIKQLSNTSETK